MTLRRQMILLIAVPALLIYLLILGLMVVVAYQESTRARQQAMAQLVASYAATFDGKLREASQIAETTAAFMETVGRLPDEKIYEQLQRDVARSPLVYGACMAFEPAASEGDLVLFAPYVCRDGSDGFRRVNIDQSVYDWYRDPTYTWFSRPKSLGHGVWSEPYFDEGAGNVLMATYSAPFLLNGKFGGVATVDIDLPRLQQTVGQDLRETPDFFVLASDGRFVYDRQSARIGAKTMFDVSTERGRPELAELARRLVTAGTPGIMAIDDWDSAQQQWVVYAPIRSTQWVFACRLPESVVLADVRSRAIWSATTLAVTLLLIVTCIVVASRLVAAPIGRLTQKVLEVGRGNLEVQIDVQSRTKELRLLATSFNRMTAELRAQVARLAVEQSLRARIERDLDIAREIQQSLLPENTPDVPGYEVTGWSKPADKTGGDYYDWQTRSSDGATLVTLADVTGHGVGPALVTAVCRAYMRASFVAGHDLGPLMDQLNDLLVADLPDDRFVTCFAALLNPATGGLQLLSAGHGPILHYRAGEKTIVQYEANGVPLGIMSPAGFEDPLRVDLAVNDFLLIVTDGFFEGARADGEHFGLQRLRGAIHAAANAPVHDLIDRLYAAVEQFLDGAAQEDDATAIVIKRSPTR